MKNKQLLFKASNDHVKQQMEIQLNSEYIKDALNSGGLYGTASIIDAESTNYFTIALDAISHRILSFEWEDFCLYGDIEILDTAFGEYLNKLYELKLYVLYLPRMVVTMNSDQTIHTINNLITFDFTLPPSHISSTRIIQAYIYKIITHPQ